MNEHGDRLSANENHYLSQLFNRTLLTELHLCKCTGFYSPSERHAVLYSAMMWGEKNKKMHSCIVTVLSIPSSPIKVEKAL